MNIFVRVNFYVLRQITRARLISTMLFGHGTFNDGLVFNDVLYLFFKIAMGYDGVSFSEVWRIHSHTPR